MNHNEAEIAGYRDALNEIHLGYEHIDFRERDILRLHEMMMAFADETPKAMEQLELAYMEACSDASPPMSVRQQLKLSSVLW